MIGPITHSPQSREIVGSFAIGSDGQTSRIATIRLRLCCLHNIKYLITSAIFFLTLF